MLGKNILNFKPCNKILNNIFIGCNKILLMVKAKFKFLIYLYKKSNNETNN